MFEFTPPLLRRLIKPRYFMVRIIKTLFDKDSYPDTSLNIAQEFNFSFIVPGTYIQRRSHSSVQNVGKDSASQGLWRYTKFSTWRSHHTNVQFVAEASINGQTSKLICSPIQITSLTNAILAGKYSEETAT